MSGEHDENISFDQMAARVGGNHAEELRRLSLAIYAKAAAHALERGLILADTKFEFGLTAKGIVLADEVLTPDSSRVLAQRRLSPWSGAAVVRQTVCARLSGNGGLE